jgi:hypothetical protein
MKYVNFFSAASGLAPIIAPLILTFVMRMSPLESSYDLMKNLLITLGVFASQFIAGSMGMTENILGNSSLNTLLIMGAYLLVHYMPLFLIGEGYRTLKSFGTFSEVRTDAIFMAVSGLLVYALTALVRNIPLVGKFFNVSNKYVIIAILTALVLLTYWNSTQSVYYTSNSIEYPFKKALSVLPLPLRVAIPVGLQITNQDVLNTLKSDPSVDQMKVYGLEQLFNVFENALPESVKPVMKLGDSLPLPVITKLTGMDLRSPGQIKKILDNELVGTALNMVPLIQAMAPMKA